MKIGIDIDNTITEVQEELNNAAYEYAIKLGKNINNAENSFEDIKNNVYDKLIVNAREKAPVCKDEKIDLFIDDQLNNCLDIAKIGIKTIRLSNDKKKYKDIITFENWDEIYNYITEME